MNILSYEQHILNDYRRALDSNCFQGSLEEFKEWSKKYCWGIYQKGHPDPPGEPGREGPPGSDSD